MVDMQDGGAKQNTDNRPMTLKIVTPQGVAQESACDSITLPLADDRTGALGGSIGIRKGHVPAELALQKGTVRAMADGRLQNSIQIDGGFALIERNTVTVIAEHAEAEPTEAPAGQA